jgi:hypothetical protein
VDVLDSFTLSDVIPTRNNLGPKLFKRFHPWPHDQSYFPSLKDILSMFIQHFYDQTPPVSLRAKESFPNAEKVLCEAYSLFDPTPALLNLINACPTEAAVKDLLFYYMDAAEDDPSRAYALTSVLVALRDSPEAPLIQDGSLIQDRFSLATAFHVGLSDLYSWCFHLDDDSICPTNTYLVTCLLSGLTLKHNLSSSHHQYYEVRYGIDCHGDPSLCELWVIGACIQLLTIGSKIVSEKIFNYSASEVATKLRSQQSASTVKEFNARKLLEVCQLFLHYELSSLLSSTACYLAR